MTPPAPTACRSPPTSRSHDAAAVAGYLADLGASHAYSSPLLRSATGSTHGYDTVDHAHVDEPRGGREGLDRFVAALHEHGLGLVLDIVPNHMGVADPAEAPLVVGRAAARPRSRARRRVRHRLGLRRRQGADARCSAPPTTWRSSRWPRGRRRPSCATTTTASRSPRAPSDGTPARRCTTGSTTSWSTGAAPTPTSTTGGSSRSTPSPGCGSRTRRSSRRPTGWCSTLVREGAVDGLRIDHPDGLADPARLPRPAAPRRSGGVWTVVEKILEPGEALPEGWATAGTTGYDALAEVDRRARRPRRRGGAHRAGHRAGRPGRSTTPSWSDASKREVTDGILGSEVARLVRRDRRAARHRPAEQQTEALAELLACFAVYRSYLPDGREHLDAAVGAVRERRPDLVAAVDALHPVLAQAGTEAATRFEQTSGPVMAKGVEDSAYYRWAGSSRSTRWAATRRSSAATVEEFHAAQRRRVAGARPVDDHAVHPRHQAQRGRPGPAGGAGRGARPSGPSWCGAGSARHPLADRPLAHLVWQNLVGAWPLSPRAGARLRGEGGPRGRDVDHVDDAGTGVRGRAARAGRRAPSTTRGRTPRSRRSSPGSRAPGGRTRWRRSWCS